MEDVEEQFSGVKSAQFHSFAKRMPSYYASVGMMMAAIAFVFHSIAPFWLSCVVPFVTILLAVARGRWWVKHCDDQISDRQAEKILARATVALIVSALVLIATDISLFRYGDDYTRFFLLIQMLSSATCGFYCLMHLRRAALVVFAAVMLPFGALTFSLGHVSTAIAAFTSILTAAVMIAAMFGYERDFFSLVKAEAEKSELSKENLRLAHVDMLTGLPNRRYFFDQIEAELRGNGEPHLLPTMGIIDLDGFKPVNDTYGHRVGDRVLEMIASRLGTLQGRLHNLSRLGGDEFVFRTSETGEAELQALGRAIARCVGECIHVEHRIICVGCSVGFAVEPARPEIDGLGVFEKADYALYHAKRTGRARSVLFSEEHEMLIREQGVLEQALRNADVASEFYLVYQPIIDLRTLKVNALECLARWRSPVLGEVSPGRFIPVAEQAGFINNLTAALMEQALSAAQSWPEEIHLSFNICPNEMASLEHTRRSIELIQKSGIAPHRVGIELTETALLNNFAEVTRHIGMFREIGASIYLDDFGTGHSSLSYIHSLPLDRVKVDKSFVQSIDSNRASLGIIRSVINLCRDLEIECVIEGVETSAQLEQMSGLNAELIQGYLFSKPLPVHQVPEYLASLQQQAALERVVLTSASADQTRGLSHLGDRFSFDSHVP